MLNHLFDAQPNPNPTGIDWTTANQRYLAAQLNTLRSRLEQSLQNANPDAEAEPAQPTWAETLPMPPALETLSAIFGLSAFERDLVLLCAGLELDAAFAPLYATLQHDPQRAYPTFSLALAVLPDAHWSALTPGAPLRRWRLLEVGQGNTLLFSPLRSDERILHYLLGVQYLDERLAGLVEHVTMVEQPVPSHVALAEQMARLWSQPDSVRLPPVVQLCSNDVAATRAVAAACCNGLGINLCALAASTLPTDARELDALMRLWEREATLSHAALLLECDEGDATDNVRAQTITRFIENIGGLLIISGRDRRRLRVRPLLSLDVEKPTVQEQRALWQRALGTAAPALNGHVDQLVAQFSLSTPAIYAAVKGVGEQSGSGQLGSGQLDNATNYQLPITNPIHLWNACRSQSRPRLDDLAQRISAQARWEDLVLPAMQRQTLREILVHVRQRATVYETWGFAGKSARGLGISALFAGTSGTGKTLAAEVLANELQLDLYRIDLSQVVSKYIGETEKNLRRVFDAAEEGGAVLLFDEADALFGKRSEVKDSHDRYANIEVSYLLQRMETYRGLAILTTNMKNALDNAFLRRIRFMVQFPFPDASQRAEIWQHIFPTETPTVGLDITRLARLNVAGGNIRNIALNGAFLAAEAGEPVRMVHLLRAAQIEYAKLEKPLTAGEVGDWV